VFSDVRHGYIIFISKNQFQIDNIETLDLKSATTTYYGSQFGFV
jgi:hypothetical protein